MENQKKGGFFSQLTQVGIRPVCPKCGHQGFVVLREDAVVNADKAIAIVTCASKSCHAAIGALPISAVWDE